MLDTAHHCGWNIWCLYCLSQISDLALPLAGAYIWFRWWTIGLGRYLTSSQDFLSSCLPFWAWALLLKSKYYLEGGLNGWSNFFGIRNLVLLGACFPLEALWKKRPDINTFKDQFFQAFRFIYKRKGVYELPKIQMSPFCFHLNCYKWSITITCIRIQSLLNVHLRRWK